MFKDYINKCLLILDDRQNELYTLATNILGGLSPSPRKNINDYEKIVKEIKDIYSLISIFNDSNTINEVIEKSQSLYYQTTNINIIEILNEFLPKKKIISMFLLSCDNESLRIVVSLKNDNEEDKIPTLYYIGINGEQPIFTRCLDKALLFSNSKYALDYITSIKDFIKENSMHQ
jgi:hypothetical protein